MKKFFRMYAADSKNYFLNHIKALKNAGLAYNVEVHINCNDMLVQVRFSNKNYVLYPQFLEIINHKPCYVEKFNPDAICFVGWRPYRPIVINAFLDKIFLKQKLNEQGFLTPAYSIEPKNSLSDVIVKPRKGSFGGSIYGPYKDSFEHPLDIENGEFFEKFIDGDILKISFWNDQPILIEQQKMPTLIGNGKSTILELAKKRAKNRDREIDPFELDQVVGYYGKNINAVLLPHERIIVDFRYESSLCQCYAVKEIPLPNHKFKMLDAELNRLGTFLFSLITQEQIPQLFYTVDAILDKDKKLWILEVNSNPTVHYCAYSEILKTLHQNSTNAN